MVSFFYLDYVLSGQYFALAKRARRLGADNHSVLPLQPPKITKTAFFFLGTSASTLQAPGLSRSPAPRLWRRGLRMPGARRLPLPGARSASVPRGTGAPRAAGFLPHGPPPGRLRARASPQAGGPQGQEASSESLLADVVAARPASETLGERAESALQECQAHLR